MRRLLLDENVPAGVAPLLDGCVVRLVAELGWAGLTNGRLIEAAEAAGFNVLVTSDRNIITSRIRPGA